MGGLALDRSLRLVVFGDGPWAAKSLRRLQQGRHRVVAVVLRECPSDPTLGEATRALRLPVLQPRDVNDPAFVECLRALTPDLGLSIAYNQILRRDVRGSAPLGCVNVHAGKLPSYRGRNVINWAIINGEREIGLTVHFMDDGIDTGDILLQHTLPIGWTDSYGDVLGRVVEAIPQFVEEGVELVACGNYTTERQAEAVGTYFGGRGEGDEWLDWADSSVNLHNKVRGISRPGPGARTLLDRQRIVIWRAYYDPAWPKYMATPGQVVGRQPGDGVFVKTGDSTLLVQEVEIAGQVGPPSWRLGTRLGVSLATALQAWLDGGVGEPTARSVDHA